MPGRSSPGSKESESAERSESRDSEKAPRASAPPRKRRLDASSSPRYAAGREGGGSASEMRWERGAAARVREQSGAHPARASARRGCARRARRGAAPSRRSAAGGGRRVLEGGPRGAREVTPSGGFGVPALLRLTRCEPAPAAAAPARQTPAARRRRRARPAPPRACSQESCESGGAATEARVSAETPRPHAPQPRKLPAKLLHATHPTSGAIRPSAPPRSVKRTEGRPARSEK